MDGKIKERGRGAMLEKNSVIFASEKSLTTKKHRSSMPQNRDSDANATRIFEREKNE
jgi:hypothetical protein